MKARRQFSAIPKVVALTLSALLVMPAVPAAADDPPVAPWEPPSVTEPGVTVEDVPVAVPAGHTTSGSKCAAPIGDETVSCVVPSDEDVQLLQPEGEAGQQDILPLPQYCLDNGVTETTWVSRTGACRISRAEFIVERRIDNIPTIVGVMNLLVYQYIYTSPDSPTWASQITVSPFSITGEAVGTVVSGVPSCVGACVLNNQVFSPEPVTVAGDTVDGESYFDWPVVANGKGTGTASWLVSFDAPTVTGPPATYNATNTATARCDNALVPSRTDSGCVFPAGRLAMTWTETGYPTYARHLQNAQASGLPGGTIADGTPLHRLVHPGLQSLNRGTACPPALPRPTGRSCDEYPFASTHEGAFTSRGTGRTFAGCSVTAFPTGVTGPVGFSSCMIDATENNTAGSQVQNYLYRPYRIIDGDPFWVYIP